MDSSLLMSWLVLSLIVGAEEVSAAAKCAADMYFDYVTGSCAPCTDICTNAWMQRTDEDCEAKCGSYLSSLTESSTKATTAAASRSPDAHKTWTITAVCVALALCLILLMAVVVYIQRRVIGRRIHSLSMYFCSTERVLDEVAHPDDQNGPSEIVVSGRDNELKQTHPQEPNGNGQISPSGSTSDAAEGDHDDVEQTLLKRPDEGNLN